MRRPADAKFKGQQISPADPTQAGKPFRMTYPFVGFRSSGCAVEGRTCARTRELCASSSYAETIEHCSIEPRPMVDKRGSKQLQLVFVIHHHKTGPGMTHTRTHTNRN